MISTPTDLAGSVVVCGSRQHPELIQHVIREHAPRVVAWPLMRLPQGVDPHSFWRGAIAAASLVVVVHKPDGSLGESVAAELAYARALNKTIRIIGAHTVPGRSGGLR